MTSASLQCGDYSPTQPLQECGYPTMWTTGLVVLNLSRTKKKKVKPDCALIGCDSNIFNLMGIASRTLKQNGMAPFIPHFYVLILDDRNDKERNIGMNAGLSMLWVCDAVWVFGDEITESMKTEIRFAEKLNIEVRYISENDLRKSEVKNDKIKKN